MQSANSIQTNPHLEEEFEKLFNQWEEEISHEPYSLAILLLDKVSTPSARQFVRLSRKPAERVIFLRFAQDKIEAGNNDFAGVVMKVLFLSLNSLLKEDEKNWISTKELTKRVLIIIKEHRDNYFTPSP